MRFGVIVGVLLALGCSTHSSKLPADWGRCHKSDPNFGQCLRKNVEDAITKLKHGAKELNLGPFDPLDIPELYIGEGKGPVNVAQHFKNVKLYGLTNCQVYESQVDFEKHIMRSRSNSPELRLQGDYDMNGRILLLPITGVGSCNVTLYNTKINHTLYAEPVQKHGKTFWRVKEYTVTLRPERMTYKFDNLFDGNKVLGDNINTVLNENWNDVFTDVREGYEKSFGDIFLNLANRVLPKVPLSEIFLD